MSKTFQSKSRQEELMRVAEQAAEWLVSLEDEAASEHEELAQWLLESPLHTQMFLRAAAIDRKGAALHPAVLKRLMDRLEMEPEQNVFPLRDALNNPRQGNAREMRARRWRPLGIAAGFLIAAATSWFFLSDSLGWERYATDIGEQRSITLPDGSSVHINTHSRVEVHYSERGRDIRLVDGEALFTVRHEASRPFRVHVNDTVVRALGTQFNIYRRANDTTVSVIEGLVQISMERAASVPRLAAGQTVTIETGGELRKRQAVDIAQVTAWREGHLVFERASLDDIVTEFNRYNRKPRIRVDERIGDKHRYTAVFDANDPRTLLNFLAKDPDLELETRQDELIVKARRSRLDAL